MVSTRCLIVLGAIQLALQGTDMETSIILTLTDVQYAHTVNALEMRIQRCKDNRWAEEAQELQSVLVSVQEEWERANTPEYPDQFRCVCGAWVWARWNYEEDFYWYQCDTCEHYEHHITVSPEIMAQLAERYRRNEQEAQELFG